MIGHRVKYSKFLLAVETLIPLFKIIFVTPNKVLNITNNQMLILNIWIFWTNNSSNNQIFISIILIICPRLVFVGSNILSSYVINYCTSDDCAICWLIKFFIIYLSFLNCDWLLIREVQWFYWTQELLVPVEKFTVRMPMVSLELATPGLQTQCSSHWATGAQKLLLGRSWVYPVGVLHHYIFIISQLWLTSHPRSTVVLLDTGTPGTSREIYSEDANGESRTRNPWITNPVL